MKTGRFTFYLILIVSGLSACSVDNSFEAQLERAHQFADESKLKSAVIELKSALSQQGNSAEARWMLGKVYLESGDVLSAKKELQRAAQLGWADDDVIPALAESMLAQGEFTEIRKLSERELQPISQSRLLAAKALSAASQGERKQANRLIRKALKISPESTHALLAKARILLVEGDLDKADQELNKLLGVDPEHADAWSVVGELRTEQRRLEDALLAYSHAIAFKKDHYAAMLKRGLLSLHLKDFESAKQDVATLMRVAPKHAGANYLQGLIYFHDEKYSDAIAALSEAENAYSKFPLVLFFLGSAQLVQGNLDQAAMHATRFHHMQPQSIPGRKLLATVSLQQGKNEEVQRLLNPMLDILPDDVGALNLMANAMLRDGKTDEGISLLTKVAELQPNSPVAQVRLGAGLLVSGQGGDAEKHIETALELNPEFQQADILLVLNHLQNRDYDAAIAAAKSYKARNPTSVTPINLLGRVYQQSGQHANARQSFENVLNVDAAEPAANHNLAQVAISKGDLATARGHYEEILKGRVDFLPALMQLALIEAREGNGPGLIKQLDRARIAHPKSLDPRLLLARYYLSAGRPEKVATLLADVDEVERNSPQVLEVTALAQLTLQEHEDAQYTLEQLMKTSPKSAALHHMMAQATSGAGQSKRSVDELNNALELDQDYLPSRIALARIALKTQDIPEFELHLEKLGELAPENPQVLLLRAEGAKRDGDGTKAVEFAEQAFTRAPATSTLLALSLHKESLGDKDEAFQLYREWVDQHPNDVAVRLVIANRLGVANRKEEARLEYEEVVRIDENNVLALNNLAWYIRDEHPEKALAYAQHASTLEKDSSAVLDTLAVVEYANEQYVQAKRSVQRALKLTPNNPSMKYHQAMILAALDEKSTALSILDELYETGADFPSMEEAKRLRMSLRR